MRKTYSGINVSSVVGTNGNCKKSYDKITLVPRNLREDVVKQHTHYFSFCVFICVPWGVFLLRYLFKRKTQSDLFHTNHSLFEEAEGHLALETGA